MYKEPNKTMLKETKEEVLTVSHEMENIKRLLKLMTFSINFKIFQ